MSSSEDADVMVETLTGHGYPSRGPRSTRERRGRTGSPLLATERYSFVVTLGLEADRTPMEKLIERIYARTYGAVIHEHYPCLVGVYAANGELMAAAGVRSAAREPLFLESYLPLPVEEMIAAQAGVHLKRAQIVEVGNLVAMGQRASLLLFGGLATHLHREGFSYVVATATRSLNRSFDRAGFESVELGIATPEALPDQGASWGSYYRRQPRVLAGPLASACVRLARLCPQSLALHRSRASRTRGGENGT